MLRPWAAKKALQIAEQSVGPDYPDVATSLENLAILYRKTGRGQESAPLEQRAADIRAAATPSSNKGKPQ